MKWDLHIEEAQTALRAEDFGLARKELSKALDIARDDFDHTDERIPFTIFLQGLADFRSCKYQDAEQSLRQAAKILSGMRASDDRTRGLANLYLASCYKLRGEMREAGKCYATARPLIESACSPEETRDYLALYSADEHQAEETETEEPEFTDLLEEAEPFSDEDTSVPEVDLSGVPPEDGKLIHQYNDLSAVLLSMWEHLDVAAPVAFELLQQMADISTRLNLLQRSAELFLLAINIAEYGFGKEDLRTAHVKMGLAHVYRKIGDYGVAFEYFRAAYEIYSQNYKQLPAQWIEENVRPFEHMMPAWEALENARSFLTESAELEQEGDFESALREAAEAYRCLKDFFAEDDHVGFGVFSALSRLFRAVGKDMQEQHMYQVVQKIAARYAEEDSRRKVFHDLLAQLPPGCSDDYC